MSEGTMFPGGMLAAGWLAVACASDKHAAPVLDRTILLERYPTGMRLVATDTYALLWSWVPDLDSEFEPIPEIEETPIASAVARDLHGRARSFMRHVGKLSDDEDQEAPIEVSVRFGIVDDSGRRSFAGLEAKWVVLDFPGHERIQLDTVEIDYPTWRNMVARFEGDSLPGFALSPSTISVIGALSRLLPDRTVRFRHGGKDRLALLELPGDPIVTGTVMPVRWDIETDAPALPALDDVDDEQAAEDLSRKAMELVITAQFASPSMLHRKLSISFADADALLVALEEKGVVGPRRPDGESRDVLMTKEELDNLKALFDGDDGSDEDE